MAADDNNNCPICLDSLCSAEKPIGATVPCGHCVHVECFAEWKHSRRGQSQRESLKCPMCNNQTTSFCRIYLDLGAVEDPDDDCSLSSNPVPKRLTVVGAGGRPPKRAKQVNHDDDLMVGLLGDDEGVHSLRKADLEIRKGEYGMKRKAATAGEKRLEDTLQIKRDELEIRRNIARAEEKKLEAETAQMYADMADKVKDRDTDPLYKLLSRRQQLRDQKVPVEEIDLVFPLPPPK